MADVSVERRRRPSLNIRIRSLVLVACLLSLASPAVSSAQLLEPGVNLVIGGPPPDASKRVPRFVGLQQRNVADLTDDLAGPQLRLVYVLPSDGPDQGLDVNGQIETSFAAVQRWLIRQSGGKRIRLDTFQGSPDILFARLSRTDAQMRAFGAFVRDEIEQELMDAGLFVPGKVYLAYYGGSSNYSCGSGAWPPALPGQLGALYLNGEPPGSGPCNANLVGFSEAEPRYWEFGGMHEVMHTLGIVSTCGTNQTSTGHTSDSPQDLMWAGPQPWQPTFLDVNRDDYYQHGIPGCLDLASSPYVEAAPAGSGACLFIPDTTSLTMSAAGDGAVIRLGTAPDCAWQASSAHGWVSLNASSGTGVMSVFLSVAPNPFPFSRSSTVVIGGVVISIAQGAASQSSTLVQNGSFSGGSSVWKTFATPDSSYLVSAVVNGVLEFYRQPPPAGTSNQAVVFQETGIDVPADAPMTATFDLGNSSSVRKRISVLMLDSDFSDQAVCTFWLPPNSPMRTYGMRTHSTRAWANASIYFYAATAGQDGGAYQLDNVSMQYDVAGSPDRTLCHDPLAPPPQGGGGGVVNILVNGNFDGGLPPWGLFGRITAQIVAGVFEFVRPAGTPAGVVLQATGQPMAAGDVMRASFRLGNSSSVRKRVTVLLHDNDFTDLAACTFWLPPGQPLSSYSMATYATRPWTNATLSVYPATVGVDEWIRLDDVTLQRTPALTISGTDCLEPAALPRPELEAGIGLRRPTAGSPFYLRRMTAVCPV